jgi:glycosyltransferase involved in cell wall biosynthesis
LITENQGLREENQGLRDDLLAAKSSLGWMTHHWIRSVLGLSRTIQVARKVRTFLNVLSPKIGVLYQHPPKTLEVPAWYFPRPPVSRAPLIVSIVTPSLNQGNYIERTIQSVISQGYMPLEYIVQDGRSSDGTRDILERYRAFLAQAQSAEDTGQANAINLGFRHASGDIMSYLNADDILLPGTLHYVAEYFATHPGVDVVYGHRVLIDEKEQEIGRWVLPPHDSEILSWVDYVPQETLFWRRRIWERVGGCLNENFRFAMDWDLLLRFREVGGRFARLPRFLGAFRVHPEQKTLSLMREVGIQEINLLLERIHGRRVSQREVEHHIRPYLWKHIWFDTLYRLGVLHY